jgi:hypothetical protein
MGPGAGAGADVGLGDGGAETAVTSDDGSATDADAPDDADDDGMARPRVAAPSASAVRTRPAAGASFPLGTAVVGEALALLAGGGPVLAGPVVGVRGTPLSGVASVRLKPPPARAGVGWAWGRSSGAADGGGAGGAGAANAGAVRAPPRLVQSSQMVVVGL